MTTVSPPVPGEATTARIVYVPQPELIYVEEQRRPARYQARHRRPLEVPRGVWLPASILLFAMLGLLGAEGAASLFQRGFLADAVLMLLMTLWGVVS